MAPVSASSRSRVVGLVLLLAGRRWSGPIATRRRRPLGRPARRAEQRRADDLLAGEDRDRQRPLEPRSGRVAPGSDQARVRGGRELVRNARRRRAGRRPQRQRLVGPGPDEDRDPPDTGRLHEPPGEGVRDLGRRAGAGEIVDRPGQDPDPSLVGRDRPRRRRCQLVDGPEGPLAGLEQGDADDEGDAAVDAVEDRPDRLRRNALGEDDRVQEPRRDRGDDAGERAAGDRREQDRDEREDEVRIAGDVLVEAQLEEECGDRQRDPEGHAREALPADPAAANAPDLLGRPVAGGPGLAHGRAPPDHSSDSGSTSTDHGGVESAVEQCDGVAPPEDDVPAPAVGAAGDVRRRRADDGGVAVALGGAPPEVVGHGPRRRLGGGPVHEPARSASRAARTAATRTAAGARARRRRTRRRRRRRRPGSPGARAGRTG